MKLLRTLIFCLLVFSPALCLAQDSPTAALPMQEKFVRRLDTEVVEREEIAHEFNSYVRFMPAAKANVMPGKVELIRSEAEYDYNVKLFEQLPIQLSLNQEYIGIDKTVAVPLPAHLIGLTFNFETTLPFFYVKDTYIRFGVSPAYYTDSWSFPSSAFRIPSRYMLIYQPDPKLTVVAGIEVDPDYKEEIGPLVGVIYKPNDRLTFNIIPEEGDITYKLNDKFSVFAQGGFNSEEFEVTRNNIKGVILMYDDIYLGGGLKFKPHKYINALLSVGSALNRSLKYRDQHGKVNIENGFYTEFRLDITI